MSDTTSVRIPRAVQEGLKLIAERNHRSVNGEASHALEEYVKANSDYCDTKLRETLDRLMKEGKLQGTGFTPDEVDARLAAMDAMPERLTDGSVGTAELRELFSEKGRS